MGVGPKIKLTSEGVSAPENVRPSDKATATENVICDKIDVTMEPSAYKISEIPKSRFSRSSSSAMLSLMEHGMPHVVIRLSRSLIVNQFPGGPVELLLSKRQTHVTDRPPTSRGSSTNTQYSSPPHTPTSENLPGGIAGQPPLRDELSNNTAKPDPTSMPQFVPMHRRLFPADAPPLTESNPSSCLKRQVRANSVSAPMVQPGLEVLVVDDDPLTRTLMKRLLTRLGCNVSMAEHGQMALDMILGPSASSDTTGDNSEQGMTSIEGKYAVVFLDNQMPILSGLKAVAKLRVLGRRDFVVGVTGEGFAPYILVFDSEINDLGNALQTDQEEYLEAGVDQ